jgi:FkbM family methyltransferase
VARQRNKSAPDGTAANETLTLDLFDGTKVVVPRSLSVMTTYVLLEQERWFEKEIDFVAAFVKPGMTVLDVGANVGIYTLSMARSVGPTGHVFAFEPSGATRALLEAGIKANGLGNVTVSPAALSDHTGTAVLGHGVSSELHSLTITGPGETVALTTLDTEDATGRWPRVDFVKLDAEGVEERILRGAHAFFKRHAPVVMFEIKDGDRNNTELAAAFRALDFVIYRSLPTMPLLVPHDDAAAVDGYELNLFAVPRQNVQKLADAGVLVNGNASWRPLPDSVERTRGNVECTSFYRAFKSNWPDVADLPPQYLKGLQGFASWRFGHTQDWEQRYAGLIEAVAAFAAFARANPSCAALSMLARAQSEAGQRVESVSTLRLLAELMTTGDTAVPVPFWPVHPRYDDLDPGAQSVGWLRISVFEQLERAAHYSTVFKGATVDLDVIAGQPFAHIELERRRVLIAARAGKVVDVPKRLWPMTADNRNGHIWRHGLVPNTRRRN